MIFVFLGHSYPLKGSKINPRISILMHKITKRYPSQSKKNKKIHNTTPYGTFFAPSSFLHAKNYSHDFSFYF
ncbi:MAG: hypothetical protein C0593_01850 [Marinilabiliales bacterium]|nr:MAG: hypothetical protein C0593_01850 [Marinilabiliales bacterium]